jgi:hypothetical protein
LLSISTGGISDEISCNVSQANEKYFTEDMCTRILQSVPAVAMYESKTSGIDGKKEYLERNWHIVRDNVEFTREWSSEDAKAMEVLRWLQK